MTSLSDLVLAQEAAVGKQRPDRQVLVRVQQRRMEVPAAR